MASLIDEYRSGVFTLKIDGKDLQVKPKNDDKLKMHSIDKKMAKLLKDTSEEADRKIEEGQKAKSEIIKEMMKRANSSLSDEVAENILTAKQNAIEEELGIAFGWYSKDQLAKMKIKQMKMLEEDEEGDKKN